MIIHTIAKKAGKYTLLLICILVSLILFPVVEESGVGRVVLNVWCLVTMLSLTVSLQGDKRHFKSTLLTGGALSILLVISLIGQILNTNSELIYHFILPAYIAFSAYIIWIIQSKIFKSSKLGANELCGSIVCYLLLGIMWAFMYTFIELISPNSFSFVAAEGLHAKGSALFYYSFVTLTTLGYGDILPVSQVARMVAYLEAVTGVMYTAILVAGLVGNIGGNKIVKK